MKENLYTKVLDRVYEKLDKTSEKIALNFKGVKPFNKEPISKSKLLEAYNTLTPMEMNNLISTHGEESVNDFIREMEELKIKRG